MTLLLDTHVWLWWLTDDEALSAAARADIEDLDNQVLVSSISMWEVVIKSQLGKLKVDGDVVAATLSRGITFLPFGVNHAQAVEQLVPLHRDPFDRALLAQAACDGLRFLTADRDLRVYAPGVDVKMVERLEG